MRFILLFITIIFTKLFIFFNSSVYSSGSSDVKNNRTYSLSLPTKNSYIFSSSPEKFYMYTLRNFEGKRSRPWGGGKYGFSRNQKRTRFGIIMTRFHEGIDVKPLYRDKNKEPLDDVLSIDDGVVVYYNSKSGLSSYGRYMVVKHNWGEGNLYSLHAHLKKSFVKVGQSVKSGQKIARLGYTGSGINKTRAHVHTELNLMLNNRFSKWHSMHYVKSNYHGNYNGLNLIGVDIAAMYKRFKKNGYFSIKELIASMSPYYKVMIPAKSGIKVNRKLFKLPILQNYPWLYKGGDSKVKSWEVLFSASGVPLSIKSSSKSYKFPKVSWVKNSNVSHLYRTRSRLKGIGNSAILSNSGSRYIQLFGDNF